MLTTKKLTACYGGIVALDKVSINIEKGSTTTVIGSNGAGKSTLLKVIAGQKDACGRVTLDGIDISKKSTFDRMNMGMTYVPEGRGLFNNLSVIENLKLAIDSKKKTSLDEKVLDIFPRLKERLNQIVGTLSGGEQQMLSLARIILREPKIVLLDEPTMGLSPLMAEDVIGMINEMKMTGMTVLLVEQNASLAQLISDFTYIIKLGEIVWSGPASNITKKDILDAYF